MFPYPAVLVLLAISVLTPYFFFIPKSCLAAVIICAVIFHGGNQLNENGLEVKEYEKIFLNSVFG
jgi:hypothetical protein